MKTVYVVISRENYVIGLRYTLDDAEKLKKAQIEHEEFQGGRPSVWIKDFKIK